MGFPNVIQIVDIGMRRIKVRGTVYDRNTGGLRGNNVEMGWMEVGFAVEKESGMLLMRPRAEDGSVLQDPPPPIIVGATDDLDFAARKMAFGTSFDKNDA